jgi:hypothetical protein
MMAAMMLPGAVPAVSSFIRANGRELAAPLFAGSYLAVSSRTRTTDVKPDEASGDVRRGTLRKLRLPRPVDKSQGSFWFQPRRLPSRTLRHRQCLGSPPM